MTVQKIYNGKLVPRKFGPSCTKYIKITNINRENIPTGSLVSLVI